MVKFYNIKLGEVCDILNGDRGYNYPSPKDFVEFGIPFINAGCISGTSIKFDNVDYISEDHYNRLSGAKIKKGDILFCLRGSLGKYALIEFDKGAPASSLAVLRAYASRLNSHFLLHTLGSDIITNQISMQNSGSSQPNLSAESVKEFVIPLPEIFEQNVIAETLSDVDNLIASLRKLINKKKSIKQGVMQELLTGKRRLAGFNGVWEKKYFGEIFEFMPTNALTREQIGTVGTVKNIHYGDVLTKYGAWLDADDRTIPVITDESLINKYSSASYVRSGDVIIADTAEDNTVGKAVEIINVNTRMLSGQHTMLCRPQEKFAERFLGYYINSVDFHNQMIPYITGIKVSSISKASLVLLEMDIPPVEEQETIVQILSDMDEEIEQLEKRLAKYQQIKQGMMQELLTGHIRLVESEEKSQNKTQIIKEPVSQNHNQHFDDAVMIAGIVNAFYSDKYPLGRKKL